MALEQPSIKEQEIFYDDYWCEIKKHLSSYQNDPLFNQIQSKVFVIELYEILKQLKMSNRSDWKWNVIRNKCFSRINSFKKKIKRLVHV
jgi:hypothetical protein